MERSMLWSYYLVSHLRLSDGPVKPHNGSSKVYVTNRPADNSTQSVIYNVANLRIVLFKYSSGASSVP